MLSPSNIIFLPGAAATMSPPGQLTDDSQGLSGGLAQPFFCIRYRSLMASCTTPTVLPNRPINICLHALDSLRKEINQVQEQQVLVAMARCQARSDRIVKGQLKRVTMRNQGRDSRLQRQVQSLRAKLSSEEARSEKWIDNTFRVEAISRGTINDLEEKLRFQDLGLAYGKKRLKDLESEYEGRLERLRGTCSNLHTSKVQLEKEVQFLKSENEAAQAQVKQQCQVIDELRTELNVAKARCIDQLRQQQDVISLKGKEEQLCTKVQLLESELAKAGAELSIAKQELKLQPYGSSPLKLSAARPPLPAVNKYQKTITEQTAIIAALKEEIEEKDLELAEMAICSGFGFAGRKPGSICSRGVQTSTTQTAEAACSTDTCSSADAHDWCAAEQQQAAAGVTISWDPFSSQEQQELEYENQQLHKQVACLQHDKQQQAGEIQLLQENCMQLQSHLRELCNLQAQQEQQQQSQFVMIVQDKAPCGAGLVRLGRTTSMSDTSDDDDSSPVTPPRVSSSLGRWLSSESSSSSPVDDMGASVFSARAARMHLHYRLLQATAQHH